jgi:hypothetical protein
VTRSDGGPSFGFGPLEIDDLSRGVLRRGEIVDGIFHGDLHPENLDVDIPRR